MALPWTLKYRPRDSGEIVNQSHAIPKIKEFILKYPKTQKKALLLHGPPGVGKTSSVYAIANELNYEVVEMNASDVRSARKVWQILGPAIRNKPFFKKGRIILIDEIDGMAGRYDAGGIGAIVNVINESRWPVILIANDPWDPSLRKVREVAEMVEFKKLTTLEIFKALKRIAAREGLDIDDLVLKALAERAKGDLRSAINDLQTLARKSGKITMKDLNILGYREREATIFQALGQMFKASSIVSASMAFANVDMDPEEIVAWIEENIPNEYEDLEEIYEAYRWLSKADIFYRRIYKRQSWSLLKYYTTLSYGGVAISKKKRYRKFTRYKMPIYFRKLAQTKQFRETLRNLSRELAKRVHTSTRRVIDVYINILRYLAMKYPRAAEKYSKLLGIDSDKLYYFKTHGT